MTTSLRTGRAYKNLVSDLRENGRRVGYDTSSAYSGPCRYGHTSGTLPTACGWIRTLNTSGPVWKGRRLICR